MIFWAFNERELQPDPVMTRDRLARLLRAARRGEGRNTVTRTGPHQYRIQNAGGVSARVEVRS